MDIYLTVKTVHIISSTILFGTGIGIAFFMFCTYFTADVHEKLYAARRTVIADYIFTLPAVLIQPIMGAWLVLEGGYEWTDLWLVITYIIYIIAGICWLPVVWIQIELKNMVMDSVKNTRPLPKRYYLLF